MTRDITPIEQILETYQDEATQLWGYKKGEEIIISAQFFKAGKFENGQAEVTKNSISIIRIRTNHKYPCR